MLATASACATYKDSFPCSYEMWTEEWLEESLESDELVFVGEVHSTEPGCASGVDPSSDRPRVSFAITEGFVGTATGEVETIGWADQHDLAACEAKVELGSAWLVLTSEGRFTPECYPGGPLTEPLVLEMLETVRAYFATDADSGQGS